eukprot:TRINITY_DN12503_c1_g3_i1.p1 TRINITY_DN12503_c1_g3~~TRINITY_DN12503_c1_g3_i1.p1  ORF type:complete len:1614 (+),score=250.11 TRINITY_DN12503_c1_g3_i1:340-4842(+)
MAIKDYHDLQDVYKGARDFHANSPRLPRAPGHRRKLSEIQEMPELESRRASQLASAVRRPAQSLDGEAVVSRSDRVREAQLVYDKLIEDKQSCEREQDQLQSNLKSAKQRLESFSSYTEAWERQLQQLRVGKISQIRNAVLAAVTLATASHVSDNQREAAKEAFVQASSKIRTRRAAFGTLQELLAKRRTALKDLVSRQQADEEDTYGEDELPPSRLRSRRVSLQTTLMAARSRQHYVPRSGALRESIGSFRTDSAGSTASTHGLAPPILFKDMPLYEYFFEHGTSVEDDLGLDLRLHLSGDSVLMATLSLKCFRDVWCMVYDPAGLVVDWLRRSLVKEHGLSQPPLASMQASDLKVIQYSSPDLRSDLKLALSLGSFVVLTEVTEHAWSDPIILSLLHRDQGKTSQGQPAIRLGDEMVEWHRDFNLLLLCGTPVAIPASLDHALFHVSMSPTLGEWQRMLFSRIVQSKAQGLHTTLHQKMITLAREQKASQGLEKELLTKLGDPIQQHASNMTAVPSAEETQWSDAVVETQLRYQQAIDKMNQTQHEAEELTEKLAALDEMGRRVAILVHGASHMAGIDSRYLTTTHLAIAFDNALEIAVNESTMTMPRLLSSTAGLIFKRLAPLLSESHRHTCQFLLATLVHFNTTEENDEQSLADFFAWLHRPTSHTASDWPMFDVGQLQDSKGGIIPLADVKLRNAQLESKIQTLVEEMNKSRWMAPLSPYIEVIGRHRSDWVAWKNGPTPEQVKLPTDLDSKLDSIARFMLVTSMRPDRFVECASEFTASKRELRTAFQTTETTATLMNKIQDGGSSRPVLVICDLSRHQVAVDRLRKTRTDMLSDSLVLCLSSSTQTQEVLDNLKMCMAKGWWLFLTNVSSALLTTMEAFDIVRKAEQEARHDSFRLFLVHSSNDHLPERLLASSTTTFLSPNLTFQGRLAQALAELPQDVINASQRSDWITILHNICLTHCSLIARAGFGAIGWRSNPSFSDALLFDTLEFAQAQYADPNATQRISAIRYFMDVTYGMLLPDSHDRAMLSTILGNWITSTALRSDYEFYRAQAPPGSGPLQAMSTYKMPQLNQRIKSKTGQVADLAINVWKCVGLDEAALAYLAHLSGQSSPETATAKISLHMREIFRQLVPFLDQTGQSIRKQAMPATMSMSAKAVRLSMAESRPPMSKAEHRRSSMGFLSRKATKTKLPSVKLDKYLTVPCPEWRPIELHRAIYACPPLFSLTKLRKRLESSGGSQCITKAFLLQVQLLNLAFGRVRHDLLRLDEMIQGRINPQPHLAGIAGCLHDNTIPKPWQALFGYTTKLITLSSWFEALTRQYKEVERAATMGLRTPSIGLGSFPAPHALLAAIETLGCADADENAIFTAEVTAREHEHLREPPSEGIFVHGLVLHGCVWDNPPGEARDYPIHVTSSLPVVHIHHSQSRQPDDATKTKRTARDDVKRRGPVLLPVLTAVDERSALTQPVFHLNVPCDAHEDPTSLLLKGVAVTMAAQ